MDQVVGSIPAPPLLSGPAPDLPSPIDASAAPGGLCANYMPPPHLFDELKEPSGAAAAMANVHQPSGRSGFRGAAAPLGHRPPAHPRQRRDLQRLRRSGRHGPALESRRHSLCPGRQDWSYIESGLTQRARLLDLLLADLYGPRQMLAEGLLPPELVFGHRGFLRPMQGVNMPGGGGAEGGRWLHFYAADIGRAPTVICA